MSRTNSENTAELLPGDAQYIPCLWWHYVQGLARFNIFVNYCGAQNVVR